MTNFNKPLLAFDAEIAAIIPEGETDWKQHKPLGISCVGLASPGTIKVTYGGDGDWPPSPRMTRGECQLLVYNLAELAKSYTLVGWNSLSFDWELLADESGLYEECSQLALDHVDMMFMVVAIKGYRLGLDKAAKGMGLEGKRKTVRLLDGSELNDMNGAKAPGLWAAGEYQAVLDYLEGDILNTLKVAQAMQEAKCLRWVSGYGKPQQFSFARLLTVRECLKLPLPNTAWMSDPVGRDHYMTWLR